MTVELQRIDEAFLFETTNAEGFTVLADASPDIGGQGKGPRPMELVLASVASCSSIDIVLLLQKQRQDLQDLRVRVTGQRTDTVPRVFTAIQVHYSFAGPLDAKKVERACRLSMEKLCSVSMMLKAGGVEITWTYEIVE
ncbi:Protein YhfA [Neolewinella maritima]|uniref:Protein YhfA n=1 Tax=Neolewinella maritima TaxID=1383882 RepID=A0ABM9B0S7_9BACT|nr:OsmC family protein [Neolewinella maritima]CAH1000406.1 Protein YhfA [Neolewinella maritima]